MYARADLCAPRRWRTIGREQGARRRWGERPLTRGAADDAQRRWGPRATATWCSRRCVRKTVGQPPRQGVEGCAAWIVCESEFHSGSGAGGAAGPAGTAGPVRGLGGEAVVGSAERREAQVSRGPGGGVASGHDLGRANGSSNRRRIEEFYKKLQARRVEMLQKLRVRCYTS